MSRRRLWDLTKDEGRRAFGFLLGALAFVWWLVRDVRPNEIMAGFVAALLFAQAFIPSKSTEGGDEDEDDSKPLQSRRASEGLAGGRHQRGADGDVGSRDLRSLARI